MVKSRKLKKMQNATSYLCDQQDCCEQKAHQETLRALGLRHGDENGLSSAASWPSTISAKRLVCSKNRPFEDNAVLLLVVSGYDTTSTRSALELKLNSSVN